MNNTTTRISSKLGDISGDVGLMREQFAELQGVMKGLRKEVSVLRLKNDHLKQSNCDLKNELTS